MQTWLILLPARLFDQCLFKCYCLRMNLILFEADELKNDTRISLSPKDLRSVHIRKILRAKPGDKLEAGIINGKTGMALIEKTDKSGTDLVFTPGAPPAGLHPVSLLLGLSRPPTVKKVLKEATALGVNRFILCGTENGEKSYRKSSLLSDGNIRRVLIEGAQQACCTILPQVSIHYSLKQGTEAAEAVFEKTSAGHLIALDNYEDEFSLTEYWSRQKDKAGKLPVILAVGSERGWTDGERQLLRNRGYTLCSMGKRVLRTETASVAGTALCLSGMGLI